MLRNWVDLNHSLGNSQMQDRYVGDIGDYVKLAILRALASDRRLGVVWWLFPDEHHNADGGHREYLQRPNEWKRFAPDLFETLLNIDKQKRRDVHTLENVAVLPNAVFVSDPVPCETLPFSLRPVQRGIWLTEIKKKLKDCDLIFLDPDNGIAPEGLTLTRRRAGKSVTIEEMMSLQECKQAMVVYHHQTHRKGGHLSEIYDLAARLRKSGLRVSGALRAKPWSPRVFFILNGDKEIHDRARGVADLWGNWITWHSEAEILRSSK
jgi:hypothetical protein